MLLRLTGSTVLKTVYGYDTLEDDDPMMEISNNFLPYAREATKPGFLIELLPWSEFVFVLFRA